MKYPVGRESIQFTELYCAVDDFMKGPYKAQVSLLPRDKKHRGPLCRMSLSEIVSILIGYHQHGFRCFKKYYLSLFSAEGRSLFPQLLSYTRFVEMIGAAWLPLLMYMETRKGVCTGISFVDSTSIAVCKNLRISRNKVFKGLAMRGKTSMGWFFGFKLHLIINDQGEILAYSFTRGNVNDRRPVPEMVKNIFGKLFGDKGYIGKDLFEELWEKNVKLVTGIKSNMKNKLMILEDKLYLRKRFIIETINDQLKNISDLEHPRHRSPLNFLTNVLGALIAYTHQPRKPAIKGLRKDLISA